MRVVHVSRGFEDYVIGYATAMAPAVKLHVVLSRKDEWMAGHLPRTVDVILSGAPPVRKASNALALARLQRTVRSLGADILHLQSGLVWEQALFATSRAARILTIHDVTQHPSRAIFRETPQWLLNIAARMADGVLVHGKSLQAAAQKQCGAHTPVGVVNHPLIQRYGRGEARTGAGRNVLFFGTMDEYKGLEYLATATSLIRAKLPDVRFVVAGGAVGVEYYRQLFSGTQVDLRIARQSDADIQALFRWADVLAMPYVEASHSGVLHLAAAFGLPVVASGVGCLFDTVTHGQSAWRVEPRDLQALVDGIVRVLSDEQLRKTLVAGICRLRDVELAPDRIAADTVRFYQRVQKK